MAKLTLDEAAGILLQHHDRLASVEALLKKQEPSDTSSGSQSLAAFEAWIKNEFDANNRSISLHPDSADLKRDEELVNTIATIERYKRKATPAPRTIILNLETLRDLPPDLAEAVEQCKLAIIRHRANKWNECSQQTFLDVFAALAQMAAKEKP